MFRAAAAVAVLCVAAFAANAAHAELLILGGKASDAGGPVTYLGDGWSADAAGVEAPVSGYLESLWVVAGPSGAQPGFVSATLLVNGEPTAMACEITSPQRGCLDADSTVRIRAGDDVRIRLEHSDMAGTETVRATILLGPRVVQVGELSPMTGTLPGIGIDSRLSSELAVGDLNDYLEDTGADWRLELVTGDSGTSGTAALEQIMSLHKKGIRVVVGAMTSYNVDTSAEYVNSNGMVVISAGSTSLLLAVPDNIFRLLPTDSRQGPLIAQLMEESGATALVPVYRDDAWGRALADGVIASFSGAVYGRITYVPSDADYPAVADGIAQSVAALSGEHGDNIAVLLVGFGETASVLEAAAAVEPLGSVAWFGTSGDSRRADIPDNDAAASFAELVGYLAPSGSDPAVNIMHQESVEFPVEVPATERDVKVQRIAAYVNEQAGRDPVGPYGYAAYDGVWLAGLALNDANLDVDALPSQIQATASGLYGASGPLALTAEGDLYHTDYGVWTVADGGWTLVAKMEEYTDTILSVREVLRGIKAQIMVESAIAEYGGSGDAIFQTLTDPSDTTYHDAELYVFVADEDRAFVAHGADPGLIGTNLRDLYDIRGVSLHELFEENATPEGVWVSYMWGNPISGDVEYKMSWIRVYDGYIFGSGIYPVDYSPGSG